MPQRLLKGLTLNQIRKNYQRAVLEIQQQKKPWFSDAAIAEIKAFDLQRQMNRQAYDQNIEGSLPVTITQITVYRYG